MHALAAACTVPKTVSLMIVTLNVIYKLAHVRQAQGNSLFMIAVQRVVQGSIGSGSVSRLVRGDRVVIA